MLTWQENDKIERHNTKCLTARTGNFSGVPARPRVPINQLRPGEHA